MRRGRHPLVVLWTLVALLLVLSLGGQIGLVVIQNSQHDLSGMLGNGPSDRRLFSEIVYIAVLVLPYVLRVALFGGVALLFVHAVRWRRAHPVTPTSRRAPAR
jgi:hypothetical protein